MTSTAAAATTATGAAAWVVGAEAGAVFCAGRLD